MLSAKLFASHRSGLIYISEIQSDSYRAIIVSTAASEPTVQLLICYDLIPKRQIYIYGCLFLLLE